MNFDALGGRSFIFALVLAVLTGLFACKGLISFKEATDFWLYLFGMFGIGKALPTTAAALKGKVKSPGGE